MRPKFSTSINNPLEYLKLKTPAINSTENDEDKELASRFVDKLRLPYNDVKRTRWTGPSSIGTSLELREDMYSVAFLYKLKRGTIFGDG